MSIEQGARALDWDDCVDPCSTKYALSWMKREFDVEAPVMELMTHFYDNDKVMALVGADTLERFLLMVNSAYMTKEYINMKLSKRQVHAIKEGAKTADQGIITSRPSFTADFLLEKIESNGLLRYLKAGVHHVPRGQTKLEVSQTHGFTSLVDDSPRHIRDVALGGLQAVGLVGHRRWNTRQHYLEAFGGSIPDNVRLAHSFPTALNPSLVQRPPVL